MLYSVEGVEDSELFPLADRAHCFDRHYTGAFSPLSAIGPIGVVNESPQGRSYVVFVG